MSATLKRSAATWSRPARRSFSATKNCSTLARPRCASSGICAIVHRPGQRAIGHRRRAVAHRLGDREQALELDAPVPARDLGLFLRRGAQQRRLGEARLEVGRDRRVVGQQQPLFGAQRRHGALRVDPAVGLAELLAVPQVHLDRFVHDALFREQDARAARARRRGAVVEGDHFSLSCVLVSKSPASWRSCSWLDGSPETRLTMRPRFTAGRWAIWSVQRSTWVYS